ncbi:MAG: filamentous hemagglutinin N-terminal domain-containing protein [Leptolyngbyaceae cyanobacterium bins.349]|nr:filamentous hemagglutinin N-terminal domain-containing protein [Leptolyngbyaceae cyanobacterium bins.349]
MQLKHWFAQGLQVGWMSLAMGAGAIVLQSSPTLAQLELIPDTAPDRNLGTQVLRDVIPGVDGVIGGTRPQNGQNLFHSFQEFNIQENRGVYFENPAGVRNILTRVTGNDPSDILGTLGVLGTANLFFINPNGIIFGRNASLDLGGGSFYGTTASGVKFGDIGEFSAVDPQPPSNLLTINPSAFFFTARPPGAIVNQSQATRTVLGGTTNGLRVRDGRTLLLLGGDVTVDGGQMIAFAGRVEIGAVTGEGSVGLTGNGSLSVLEGAPRGEVTFTNNSFVTVQLGDGSGGDIGITANNINVLGGSQLVAGIFPGFGTPTSQSGDIILNAAGLVQVAGKSTAIGNQVGANAMGKSGNVMITSNALEVRESAQLSADTFGTGDGGNMMITTNALEIRENAQLSADTFGTGDAGHAYINTRNLNITNGGFIAANTFGKGGAGNVTVAAEAIALDGTTPNGSLRSSIGSSVGPRATGTGGNVYVNTRTLSITNGALIVTNTLGKGSAGDVTVAAEAITINGTTPDGNFRSSIRSSVEPRATGAGGNVYINTRTLNITNEAAVNASTFGDGNSGGVMVVAEAITLNGGNIFSQVEPRAIGTGGDIRLNTRTLSLTNGAWISARTSGNGSAGKVTVTAEAVTLDGMAPDGQTRTGIFSSVVEGGVGTGGKVSIHTRNLSVANGAVVSVSTFGTGIAGDVTVAAEAIALDGGAIFSQVASTATGNGGNVSLNTRTLTLTNGGQLAVSTFGNGHAGNVTVAAEAIALDGTTPNKQFSSGIFSPVTETATGDGGNVSLNTRTLNITNGAVVNASTRGQGSAGDVSIVASEAVDLARGGIFTASTSFSLAGDITVTAPQIRMNRGVISAESAAVDGGNINLNVGRLLLMRNGSLISATAGTAQQGGDGGNITINAPRGFIVGVKGENSDITANAFTGSGGRVNITAQGIFGLQFRPQRTLFSDITASSTFGISGTVILNTPNIDPSRGLTQLPQNLIDTNGILANSCIVRDAASGGTFIITGTGGLPLRPGDSPLPAFPTGEVQGVAVDGGTDETDRGRTASGASITNPLPETIAEAQGIYKLPDGQVILSWECGNRN